MAEQATREARRAHGLLRSGKPQSRRRQFCLRVVAATCVLRALTLEFGPEQESHMAVARTIRAKKQRSSLHKPTTQLPSSFASRGLGLANFFGGGWTFLICFPATDAPSRLTAQPVYAAGERSRVWCGAYSSLVLQPGRGSTRRTRDVPARQAGHLGHLGVSRQAGAYMQARSLQPRRVRRGESENWPCRCQAPQAELHVGRGEGRIGGDMIRKREHMVRRAGPACLPGTGRPLWTLKSEFW